MTWRIIKISKIKKRMKILKINKIMHPVVKKELLSKSNTMRRI